MPFEHCIWYYAKIFTEKKSALNETHQNGFVDLKKLPSELKCGKKLKFKYTEPYKILHLDTLSESSPRNLFKFPTKPKKVSQKKNETQEFRIGFQRLSTKP